MTALPPELPGGSDDWDADDVEVEVIDVDADDLSFSPVTTQPFDPARTKHFLAVVLAIASLSGLLIVIVATALLSHFEGIDHAESFAASMQPFLLPVLGAAAGYAFGEITRGN